MSEPVKVDLRRALLKISQHGALSEEAIRAAYWRIVRHEHPSNGGNAFDFEQVRKAKRELLTEVGIRIPAPRRK
jgi:hypothetical protein